MWRSLAFGVSTVCVLLCIADAAVWLRTQRAGGFWRVGDMRRAFAALQSFEGTLKLDCEYFHGGTAPMRLFICPTVDRWDFGAGTYGVPPGHWTYVSVTCPHWFVFVALSPGVMLPLVPVIRRRRRARRGLCVNCGYNLRASPVRCPECGTRRARA